MATARAGIPEAFAELLQPHRYKCFLEAAGLPKALSAADKGVQVLFQSRSVLVPLAQRLPGLILTALSNDRFGWIPARPLQH